MWDYYVPTVGMWSTYNDDYNYAELVVIGVCVEIGQSGPELRLCKPGRSWDV